MYTSCTVILFCVSVPVLSEHITETQPRLSTALSSFMIALSAAIFLVPMACTIVTIEPSASGIAATASATANIRESSTGCFWINLNAKTITLITMITMASFLLKLSRLFCNGVLRSPVLFISPAILPISVFMPVPVTTVTALPYVTRLPEYTMFTRSASAVLSKISQSFLSTLADSPVSELSLTCNE